MLYDPETQKRRYCKKCNEYKIVNKDAKSCPDCKSILIASHPYNNTTKEYRHKYSPRESSHLNKNQGKKINLPITITFEHILVVIIAILSLLFGSIYAILNREAPVTGYIPSYNEEIYTKNTNLEEEKTKYIPNEKEKEVKIYFDFLVSELNFIDSIDRKRKDYLSSGQSFKYTEIVKEDIITLDKHIKIIKNREIPQGFQNVNSNLYGIFNNYENLLEAQYNYLVTNRSSYKSRIDSKERSYNYFWGETIENLRMALIKNKIPFNDRNGSVSLKY